MAVKVNYIIVKDKEIPINIKNYKNAKTIKIYFKGNVLNITKPTRLSLKNLSKIIKENENDIYIKYKKILSSEIQTIKQWKTGEKFYYKGIEFTIKREYENTKKLGIKIDETEQVMKIILPLDMQEEEVKPNVDILIKKLLKNNTEAVISEKLPYWSKITGLEYNSVKVRDAITRYGSCMPSKKNLYFSSRLVMLPEKVVDSIIVHELCHMVHKEHNKEFYKLAEKYIPDYNQIDNWLSKNGKMIMF